MVDWARVVGFDWDAGNERKNVDKHGVTRAEAEQVFFNEPLLVLENDRHSVHEPRFHSLGRSNEMRRLHITFALRRENTLIRVISARDMSVKERAVYDESA